MDSYSDKRKRKINSNINKENLNESSNKDKENFSSKSTLRDSKSKAQSKKFQNFTQSNISQNPYTENPPKNSVKSPNILKENFAKKSVNKNSSGKKNNNKEFLTNRKVEQKFHTEKKQINLNDFPKGKFEDLDYDNNSILKESKTNRNFNFNENKNPIAKTEVKRFNKISINKNENDNRICVSDEEIKELKANNSNQSNNSNYKNDSGNSIVNKQISRKNSAKKIFKKFLKENSKEKNQEQFDSNSDDSNNSNNKINLQLSENLKKSMESNNLNDLNISSIKKLNNNNKRNKIYKNLNDNEIQNQKSKIIRSNDSSENSLDKEEKNLKEENSLRSGFNKDIFDNSMKMFKGLGGLDITNDKEKEKEKEEKILKQKAKEKEILDSINILNDLNNSHMERKSLKNRESLKSEKSKFNINNSNMINNNIPRNRDSNKNKINNNNDNDKSNYYNLIYADSENHSNKQSPDKLEKESNEKLIDLSPPGLEDSILNNQKENENENNYNNYKDNLNQITLEKEKELENKKENWYKNYQNDFQSSDSDDLFIFKENKKKESVNNKTKNNINNFQSQEKHKKNPYDSEDDDKYSIKTNSNNTQKANNNNNFSTKITSDFFKAKKKYAKNEDGETSIILDSDLKKLLEEDFEEANASEIELEEDIFKKAKEEQMKQKIKDKYKNKNLTDRKKKGRNKSSKKKRSRNFSSDNDNSENENSKNENSINEQIDKIYRHKSSFVLAKYQLELLNWMDKRGNVRGTGKGGIISLPMGAGKTFTTLCKVMKDFEESNRPSLIIVPKSILSVWTEEIEKFFPEDECPYLIYHKNIKSLHNKFNISILRKVKIVLTTYPFILGGGKKLKILENVVERGEKGKIKNIVGKRLPRREPNYSKLEAYELLFNFVFENIICDESHKFANVTNKTFFSLLNMYSKKKWCLTGNLIMNSDKDLNSQLLFIGVNSVDIDNRNKMRYVFYREGIQNLINLPNKNIHKEIIPLSPIEQEFYNYYKNSYKKAFENNYDIFEEISCMLVVLLRFRQLCIHPLLLNKMNNKREEKKSVQGTLNIDAIQEDIEDNIPKSVKKWILEDLNKKTSSTKVIRAVEILQEIPSDEKVIIFSFFTDTFLQIEEYMKMKKLRNIGTVKIEGKDKDFERDLKIQKFREDPKIKVMFITFSIGSCGLNLFCANNIIMMDLWWNFAVFDQSIGRIYRNGQNKDVNIYVLMIKDSIDLYLWELIEFKREILKSLTTNKPMEKDKSKTRQLFEDCLYNDSTTIRQRKIKLGEALSD